MSSSSAPTSFTVEVKLKNCNCHGKNGPGTKRSMDQILFAKNDPGPG